MKHEIVVQYGCDFINVKIGEKDYYASHDDISEFAEMFRDVLADMGYVAGLEEVY